MTCDAKLKFFGILIVFWCLLAACASAPTGFEPIPKPPASADLRIFVQPLTATDHPGRGWKTPHEEFKAKTRSAIEKILQRKGIYALTAAREEALVIAERKIPAWQWEKEEWNLAREVGRALHAEYTMVVERGFVGRTSYWRIVLINVASGKSFSVYATLFSGSDQQDYRRMVKAAYKALFHDAKADLLATAIRKSRLLTASPPVAAVINHQRLKQEEGMSKQGLILQESPAGGKGRVEAQKQLERGSAETGENAALAGLGRRIRLEAADGMETPVEGRVQVAVYDFEAVENQRVVALILAEALREELFHRGAFTLVNRENLKEALKEISLGQAGILDEKQAAKAGRMLAANQIVLGRLAAMGENAILQVKRVDTESQRALGFASGQCTAGKEHELLERMPELAGRLAENR